MMAAQEGLQHKRPAAKPDEETRLALEKARAEAEAALARAKDEERARLKAEEALTEAQALRALAGARKPMGAETENTELPPAALGEGGAERRVTFIIRLTVDERGQPRRTEVEHAQSGKKETFPGLDVQRLAAFMEACISPPNHPRTDDPPSTSPCESGSPNARTP